MNDLSPEQEVLLEELILKYREVGEQIREMQELRARIAKELVKLLCPFKIGEQVYVQKPIKRFNEPVGICQVVDIIPIGHNSIASSYQDQPGFTFTVRKVLSSGELSQLTHTTYMPSRWRKAK
jgi:hypothetical protein